MSRSKLSDPPAGTVVPAGTRPHWLKPAGTARTLRVIVSFDTETTETTINGNSVLRLRCWSALTRVRATTSHPAGGQQAGTGTTPAGLADHIEAAALLTGEAWCFAHNLGFDLAVTALPDVLCGRGWVPTFTTITDESCVFMLNQAGRRLVITDSWTWLRCSLDTAARDVGRRKNQLPDHDAGDQEWQAHCDRDVMLLDRIMCTLLDWWDSQQLGAFTVTSSGCGWRSMRAKTPVRRILVGPAGDRTLLERSALHSGRKQVWQTGQITGRRCDDWDFRAAYPTALAGLPVPERPLDSGRWAAQPDPLAPPAGTGTICRVKVTTRRPCAPCRIDGDVWWPVGTFITTLTSPELEYVLEVADQVQVLQAQWYRVGDALAPWAQWCLDLQNGIGPGTPRVVRRVAKGWGRSVIGRFSLQTSRLIGERDATRPGWGIETGNDVSTGRPVEVITWGGVERTYLRDQDGQDILPAVTAFVEGHVRAALARAIDARPPGHVIQCNTDGWWELRPAAGTPSPAEQCPAPFRAVRKTSVARLRVLGPNHVEAPGDRRLSGIPAEAEQRPDGSFVWQDWPGLRWQLEVSRPGEYVRPVRTASLQHHYVRGWVQDDGKVLPPAVMVTAGGVNALRPWSGTPGGGLVSKPAGWQHASLHALRDL